MPKLIRAALVLGLSCLARAGLALSRPDPGHPASPAVAARGPSPAAVLGIVLALVIVVLVWRGRAGRRN
jgi:hypothetical protein